MSEATLRSRPPDVGFAQGDVRTYPSAPFHPPGVFPEFHGTWLETTPTDPENHVYALVRAALFRLLVGPGGEQSAPSLAAFARLGAPRRIVVKPNWVRQRARFADCVTTHGSVLRPVIDYLLLAFPKAEIIVADIPIQSADLDQVWAETGISSLANFYKEQNKNVRFLDFRRERAVVDPSGFILRREALPGDPRGYQEVALGASSWVEHISAPDTIFSVDDYEPGLASCHHAAGRHSYLIARSVLEADLFVNVPKLKTHMKAGLTACMKNLIGINGDKGWIPHFRVGSPSEDGDEYPDSFRLSMKVKGFVRRSLQQRSVLLFRMAQKLWRSYRRGMERVSGTELSSGGAWAGNDTVWRSVLDLVRVVTFGTADGKLQSEPARRQLCIIDGVICGEGEGPLDPSPRPAGVIIASDNPVSADFAAAHVAGLLDAGISQIDRAHELSRYHSSFPSSPDSPIVASDSTISSIRSLPTVGLRLPAAWSRR